jgi:hypothetical protein
MIGLKIHVEQEKSHRNVSECRFCQKCKLSLSNTLQVCFCRKHALLGSFLATDLREMLGVNVLEKSDEILKIHLKFEIISCEIE